MKYISKRFSTYPWHSINIVPHASLTMIYDDGEVPTRYGTLLELVWLGQVVHIDLPIKLKRGHSLPMWGPLWSKRRRMWYRAK